MLHIVLGFIRWHSKFFTFFQWFELFSIVIIFISYYVIIWVICLGNMTNTGESGWDCTRLVDGLYLVLMLAVLR